jgi:hypothetical protein
MSISPTISPHTSTHNECLRHHRRVSVLPDCDMDPRDFAVLHTLDTEAQVCGSARVIGQLLTGCRDAVSALGNLLSWKMVDGARKSWIPEYVRRLAKMGASCSHE